MNHKSELVGIPFMSSRPSSDSTVAQIAEEVLSLTKINWNSTQMNQRLPVPIRAARKVGEVLKYMTEGQAVSPDYRRYI